MQKRLTRNTGIPRQGHFKNKAWPILSLVIAPLFSLQAETWYLTEEVASPLLNPGMWRNHSGEMADAISSDDTLHIAGLDPFLFSNKTLTHNGPLHLGNEQDGSGGVTLRLQGTDITVTLNDLRWHAGIFQGYAGGKIYTIAGKAMLDHPAKDHKLTFAASKSYAGMLFNSDLSASDPTTQIRVSPTALEREKSVFSIGGDNSKYFGQFRLATDTLPFVLASANALGAPDTPRSDALVVENADAVLSVKKGVTPNAARGIAIEAAGFRICATNYAFAAAADAVEDCTSFELPMPLSSTDHRYGFTKDGDGTVTLSGAYSAGEIVVANGTLHLAASAEFPAEQKITVASGASLFVHQKMSQFKITAEEGAVVERVIDPLTVAYDAELKTATALAGKAGFEVPAGARQPIALSTPVLLPQHDGLTLEVLTVAPGAGDLSAGDFIDATEKPYGLPHTAFSVTKDPDGTQHVFLTVKPVVTSRGAFSNDVTLSGSAEQWSDEKAAHDQADYLLSHSVAKIGNEAFKGDSLTVVGAESGHLYTRGDSQLPRTNLYPPLEIIQNNSSGGGDFDVSGEEIRIVGAFADKDYVVFSAKYRGGYHRLVCNLTGAGPLMLQCKGGSTQSRPDAESYGNPQLYGDNSAFTGRMYVTQSKEDQTESAAGALTIDSPEALGGPLAEFRYNALILDRYSRLRPTRTMTLETENRGIYGLGPFSFDVPDDVVLTVKETLRLNEPLYKHGDGALVLGGSLILNKNSGAFYVREGGVAALTDAAVEGLTAVFSDRTQLIVRSDAVLERGFAGVSVQVDAAAQTSGKVRVVAAENVTPTETPVFTAAICTVDPDVEDLSGLFTLIPPKGMNAELIKERVTVGSVEKTRYRVKYTRKGFSLIVR